MLSGTQQNKERNVHLLLGDTVQKNKTLKKQKIHACYVKIKKLSFNNKNV